MATEGGAEGGDALTPERGGGSPGAPPGSAAAESALLSEAEAWLTQSGPQTSEGPSLHSVAKLKVRESRRRGATSPKHGRALRDFPADTEGDLELRTGDRVIVTKSNPSRHWWSGHIEGDTERSGSFPKDFIEILGDAPASAAALEPPAPAPAPATTPVRQQVSLSARTPQPEPKPGRAFSLPDLEPEPEPEAEPEPEPEPAARRQPPPPPPEAASPTEAASPPSASPPPPVTPQPRPASFNLDDVEDITPMLTSPRRALPSPPASPSVAQIDHAARRQLRRTVSATAIPKRFGPGMVADDLQLTTKSLRAELQRRVGGLSVRQHASSRSLLACVLSPALPAGVVSDRGVVSIHRSSCR